ncbi:MAG: O-Antigen ligase [Solirubrobacteraceae bacterium]|jgi:O-antigen ligase|nr:O-Antigen ligase [Solirubrobacteraceae bacterium]
MAARGRHGDLADLLALGLVAVAAIGLGALIALSLTLTGGLIVGGLVIAVLFTAPISAFAGINVVMLAIVPIVALTPSTSSLIDVVGGPARLTLVIVLILMGRLLIVRRDPQFPPLVLAAVSLAVLTLLLETTVGLAADASPSTLDDLSRDALFPLAALTGALSTTMGGARAYHWLGWVAFAVFAASIVYWASVAHGFGGSALDGFFAPVRSLHDYHDRTAFPFANDSPNGSATSYVLLMALICPVLWTWAQHRVLGAAIAVLGVVAVLTTQSRTGLLALAAAIAAIIVMTRPPNQRLPAVALAVVVVGGFLALSPRVLPTQRQLSADAPTLLARKSLWTTAVQAFGEAPLLGHGHRFAVTERFVEPAAISNRPANATTPARQSIAGTQSEYLAQLVDGGVLGGIALGAVGGLMCFAAYRLKGRERAAFRVAMYAVVAAAAVAMISTQITLAPATQSIVWLAFGMTAGLWARPDAR